MTTIMTQKTQLESQLRVLNQISIRGFMQNEKIEQRRKAQLAFEQKERQRLEADTRNALLKSQKKQLAIQMQASNREEMKRTHPQIKRSKADEAFSMCVRLRANGTCERCGEQFPLNAMKHLHCSHNYSREYKQVRFHPDNAFALCKDCHYWFAKNKTESTAWKNEYLGKTRLNTLFAALQNGEQTLSPEEEKRIAAYYKLVAIQLMQARNKGNTARLDFDGYQPFHQLVRDL